MTTSETAGLRILLTNVTLAGRSGTETVTRDLALGLLRAGHRPMVYSPSLGVIADELRRASIPVTADIARIRETPDVIHGHHVIQTAVAATRFPATPALFVCHDFNAWHDVPPRLPNLRGFVAISDGFRERLVIEQGVDPSRVRVVLNAVDIHRFKPGPPPVAKPRKALAFAKNHGHLAAIREACARRGVTVDAVGVAVGRVIARPEDLLADYDLVFTSALTAIEAMACLRPVIVCDGRGLAGLVTSERYEAWRRENFGLRILSRAVTVEAILAELDLYDAADAVAVGTRVRTEAHLEGWTQAYADAYREIIAEAASAPSIAADTLARATALHLQTWSPGLDVGGWTGERDRLLEDIARLSTELEAVPLGETVSAADSRRVALNGFHDPESWGRWSARRRCAARFRLAAGARPTRIEITISPFFTPSRQAYDVTCKIDGETLGSIGLDRAEHTPDSAVSQAFDLPEGDFTDACWLTFETELCLSPMSEGLSLDHREFGFGLVALAVS